MNVPQVSIRKILYTTDLSETGRHAFAYAASLSKLYDAKLTVMHVVDEQPELDHRLAGYMPEELWQEIKDRDLEEAKETLLGRQRDNTVVVGECVGRYCSEILVESTDNTTINYDIVVKLGDPVPEIVKYAVEQEYDMIVAGRHGHTTLHEAVHRCTVRSILKATNIPVLVVQLPE
jgi:nucleotide-binding universal stress UspA family protein